jgi:hypothetical protein
MSIKLLALNVKSKLEFDLATWNIMNYNIIQPPFTLNFREMSKKELKDYYQWFHEVMPLRIEELTRAVTQSLGFEGWQPNYAPDSLNLLGEWFALNVTTRKRSTDELQKIKDSLTFPIEISDDELTNQTYSLAMDIGMYIAQVFLRNDSSLKWAHQFGGKRGADYGQPVVVNFSSAGTHAFNPVYMMITLAFGLKRKTKTGNRLREIYEIWSKIKIDNELEASRKSDVG